MGGLLPTTLLHRSLGRRAGRAPPFALNVDRVDNIGIIFVAAFHAAQTGLAIDDCPPRHAYSGVLGWHGVKLAALPIHLVVQLLPELTPTLIALAHH